MNKYLKLAAVCFLMLTLMCACSKNEEVIIDDSPSEEEINSRYDEIMNSSGEELLSEDYNPIVDSFTTVDFQLTMTDDTTAFNLPENSYAVITAAATKFKFFDSSLQGETFAGSFKTAKGLSLMNSVAEFLSAYKVEQGGALCRADDGSYSAYDGVSFAKRITFGFASDDGLGFSPIGADELQRILKLRDPLLGGGIDSSVIESIVSGKQTVALVDLAVSDALTPSEVTISRFDKAQQ
ncbi:MAG: hypothetical protein IKA95_06425 [Clostridia bacterium]|nr:hypothetical protein [Clostridia bacterium]